MYLSFYEPDIASSASKWALRKVQTLILFADSFGNHLIPYFSLFEKRKITTHQTNKWCLRNKKEISKL